MLERFNAFLWGVPVLGLILGTGVLLSLGTGFVQVRLLPAAFREFWGRLRRRDSGFRALCTALAATVGTGNIAGVAGAIAIGGPGAVFWMWVSAFFGMAVKFAESVLSVRYREPDGRAGPMYIIRKGLKERWHWLAYLYSFFGIIAAFGVGNTAQVNAVVTALEATGVSHGFGVGLGFLLALLVSWMVRGGAGKIAGAAEVLVPVVGGAYVMLCIGALVLCRDRIGVAIAGILRGAFAPEAVTGGVVGSMMATLRIGVSRGTFTNEAGMGTAAIAHGSAGIEPVRQGLMGIMEVFLDTIVICTLTALVILTGGIAIPYGKAAGSELTAAALGVSFGPWVRAALCGFLALFALATILGWSFYAGRCAEFLLGRISWKWFGLCQGAAVVLGLFLKTGTVWTMAELFNGLMAIPNLIAILILRAEVKSLLNVDSVSAFVVSYKRGDTHEKKHDLSDPGADASLRMSGGTCS